MSEPPLGMVKQIKRLERELAEAKVTVDLPKDYSQQLRAIYNAAIEEAARVADSYKHASPQVIASSIRALVKP